MKAAVSCGKGEFGHGVRGDGGCGDNAMVVVKGFIHGYLNREGVGCNEGGCSRFIGFRFIGA